MSFASPLRRTLLVALASLALSRAGGARPARRPALRVADVGALGNDRRRTISNVLRRAFDPYPGADDASRRRARAGALLLHVRRARGDGAATDTGDGIASLPFAARPPRRPGRRAGRRKRAASVHVRRHAHQAGDLNHAVVLVPWPTSPKASCIGFGLRCPSSHPAAGRDRPRHPQRQRDSAPAARAGGASCRPAERSARCTCSASGVRGGAGAPTDSTGGRRSSHRRRASWRSCTGAVAAARVRASISGRLGRLVDRRRQEIQEVARWSY